MRLFNDRASAVVDLDGGRLASLRVDGLELLVTEGEKPTRWGSFPMVPWCGRLPHGRLEHGGEQHEFPLTSPPHANHGVAHLQAWREIGDGRIRTELTHPWPYGGLVTQTFQLAEDSLRIAIEVRNDDRSMPAMAGWHPWFRRVLDDGSEAELRVTPGRRYELDAEMIPTGRLVDVAPEPWNETFVELDGDPSIRWGDRSLEISSSFDHWVIFTEPEHALCVEPQSGPPNELNRAPHLVTPDTPLVGWMQLRWR